MSFERRLFAFGLAVVFVFGCGEGDEPRGNAQTEADAEGQPTLVEIMRGLEADMARLAHGVWVADFDAVAEAAQAVADHPQVGPDQRTRILTVLGEDGAGFRQADMRVHNLAIELGERARTRDTPAILESLARLQTACVSCHTAYRERLQAAGIEGGA